MAEQHTPQMPPQPRNIFECINQNIVDLSQDMVALYQKMETMEAKIDAIYMALYPSQTLSEPDASGADTINE